MGDGRLEMGGRGRTHRNKTIDDFVNAAQVNAIRLGKSAGSLVAGKPMSGVDPGATLAFFSTTRTLRAIWKKRHAWRILLLGSSGSAAG